MAVGLMGLVESVAGNNGGDINTVEDVRWAAGSSSGTGCNLVLFRGGDNDGGDRDTFD